MPRRARQHAGADGDGWRENARALAYLGVCVLAVLAYAAWQAARSLPGDAIEALLPDPVLIVVAVGAAVAGLTAARLARRYGRELEALAPGAPEWDRVLAEEGPWVTEDAEEPHLRSTGAARPGADTGP